LRRVAPPGEQTGVPLAVIPEVPRFVSFVRLEALFVLGAALARILVNPFTVVVAVRDCLGT